jgi:hypothetical protein
MKRLLLALVLFTSTATAQVDSLVAFWGGLHLIGGGFFAEKNIKSPYGMFDSIYNYAGTKHWLMPDSSSGKLAVYSQVAGAMINKQKVIDTLNSNSPAISGLTTQFRFSNIANDYLGDTATVAHVVATAISGEQLRAAYDGSNYVAFTVGSGGNATITTNGSWFFNTTGKYINPTTNYDQNLGQLSNKYLTLHAAELWVETLVAQNTLATIGGRILVGPTNILSQDLSAGATTLYVKYNNLAQI